MTPEQMLNNVAHVVAINQSRESIMTSIGTQEVAWLLAMAREAMAARDRLTEDGQARDVGEDVIVWLDAPYANARAESDRLLAELSGGGE